LDFTHYYGKHKRQKQSIRQTIVRHDNRLSCRLSQDTWNEIDDFMDELGNNNLSNAIETLLSDSLLDYKIAKQKYELSDI
jgi:hypothetical protein